MVKSINYIILQLKLIQDQIKVENAKYMTYLKFNLRGKAQASQVHLKNLLKKDITYIQNSKLNLEDLPLKSHMNTLNIPLLIIKKKQPTS